MKTHRFQLTFDVTTVTCSADDMLERLAEAGCTDALAGLGTPGLLRLGFLREAPTRTAARTSALRDVMDALPAARQLA